jgi:hypothetical protein
MDAVVRKAVLSSGEEEEGETGRRPTIKALGKHVHIILGFFT